MRNNSLCAHAADVVLKHDVVVVDSEVHRPCEDFRQLHGVGRRNEKIKSNLTSINQELNSKDARIRKVAMYRQVV
jgi:hypothetical protein